MFTSYVSNLEREREDFETLQLLESKQLIDNLSIIPFSNSPQCTVEFTSNSDVLGVYLITQYSLMEFQYEGGDVEDFTDICSKLLVSYGVTNGTKLGSSIKFFIDDDNFLYVRPEEVTYITSYLQDYIGKKFYSYNSICDIIDNEDLTFHPKMGFYYVNSNTDTKPIDEVLEEYKSMGMFGVNNVVEDSIVRQILVSYYGITDLESNSMIIEGKAPFDESFYNNAYTTITQSKDVPYIHLKMVGMNLPKFHCKFVYSFYTVLGKDLMYHFTEEGVSFQCPNNTLYHEFIEVFTDFADFVCTTVRSTPGTGDGLDKALELRYTYSNQGIRSFYSANERDSNGIYYICTILPQVMNQPLTDIETVSLKESILGYYSTILTSSFEVIDQEDISEYDIGDLVDLYITPTGNPLKWSNYDLLPLPKKDPVTNTPMKYSPPLNGIGIFTWGPFLGIHDYQPKEEKMPYIEAFVISQESDEWRDLRTKGYELYRYMVGHKDGTFEELTSIIVPNGRQREFDYKMDLKVQSLVWISKWSKHYVSSYGVEEEILIELPSVFLGDITSVKRSENIMDYLGISR
jgi:hypothetical protein